MAVVYPKKILVVDDEPDVLTSLGNILRRANFIVFSAATGEEALEIALSKLPDLIFLDIVLPGMEGSEVAAALLEDPKTAQIPVVFLTGIINKEEESLPGVKSGRHYVMAKPAAKEDILAMIKNVLSA